MNRSNLWEVAILGSGTMGAQIAYTCAAHGHRVRLVDREPAAMDAARARHREWAAKELPDPASGEALLARISFHAALEPALTGANLVIEALPEDLELKRRVFAELDALCPPQVILASNSSSLRMSRIETGVKNRQRVCNLHFFQRSAPVIEVMGGSATDPMVLERVRQFAVSLGLLPLVLRRESTGFLYNRIWRAVKKEVLREAAEGVASPEDIDRVVMLMWRWEKGPFGWMDAVGLDVVRDIERVYCEESGDPKDKPPAFLDEMIARGELGVKAGKGFYTYPNPAYEQPGWLLAKPVDATEAGKGISRADFVGAWCLVSWESVTEGKATAPFGTDARGSLVYTADGRMSVILSRSDRASFAQADPGTGTPEEKIAAFESCFAYAGTFEVEEGRVIHRLDQCTFPNWIGTAQVRFVRFEGGRLTLTTPPALVGGRETVSRLVWARVNS